LASATARRAEWRESVEQIAFDWDRDAAPIKRVNPLDLDGVDQIHTVGGSPQAIPTDRDLVSGPPGSPSDLSV
jgi:hypothetical protein